MRFITTRQHGIWDYIVNPLLMLAPWLLGFARGGPETWIPFFIGLIGLVGSMSTDYEMGLIRAVPMAGHLALDIVVGIFLAISPWLFGFADYVYWPHLVVGLAVLLGALMTQSVPSYGTSHRPHMRPM